MNLEEMVQTLLQSYAIVINGFESLWMSFRF